MYLSKANQLKIASLKGIEAIIKAMSRHKDHCGVQKQACGALWNLALSDGILISLFILSSHRMDSFRFLCFVNS
jgi:hypothetical protein